MTRNPAGAPTAWLKRYWGLLIVVAVMVLMAGVRFRTRDFFLERDEGEYAYSGQLMLKGIPPYQMAYNMKFPGTYAAYAAIMAVFGETPSGIRLGLLCMTSLTALMLYWLGRKLIDETAGVMAAITCSFLSASPSLFGMAGHATHFVAFFVTAGTCLLWPGPQNVRARKLFAAGLLFGLAVLMKQHAAIFALWGLGLLAFANLGKPHAQKLKSLACYSFGVVTPFAVTCVVLWRAGVFPPFWFWTVTYAGEYVSVVPLALVPAMFHFGFVSAVVRGWFLWIVGGLGLVPVCFEQRFQKIRPALLSFTLASFLTTCPGFFFRAHYFLVMVPALSLLAGCLVTSLAHRLQEFKKGLPPLLWPLLMYALTLGAATWENSDVWFALTPIQAARELYLANPFPESAAVAEYIRTNSTPADTVAVLGSEPEIYFLSRRFSATGYIYTYPLMEPQPFAQGMQEQMIQQIEQARPRYVVSVDCEKSWLPQPHSDLTIFNWWSDRYRANYEPIGFVEILSPTETRYTWGPAAARDFANTKGNALILYQRKSR
jgi:4-amino-4-deoxy-L-arabinose transferase-like glycosyltransferase